MRCRGFGIVLVVIIYAAWDVIYFAYVHTVHAGCRTTICSGATVITGSPPRASLINAYNWWICCSLV